MWINNIIYIEAHYVNKYIGWVFSSSNVAIVTTVIGQSRGGGGGSLSTVHKWLFTVDS